MEKAESVKALANLASKKDALAKAQQQLQAASTRLQNIHGLRGHSEHLNAKI